MNLRRFLNRAGRVRKIVPLVVRANGGVLGATRSVVKMAIWDGLNGLKKYCNEVPIVPHSTKECGYVIAAPDYWGPTSVGVNSLFKLCHLLNEKGVPSFMAITSRTRPDLNAPIAHGRTLDVLIRRGFIAVYPETIRGNPLQARRVARWVLNRPGLIGGDEAFDPRELVFVWSDVYAPSVRNVIRGKLQLPMIDETVFYADAGGNEDNRWIECFYIGKSTWKAGIVDRRKAYEITRTSPEQKELGKLFRQSRILYCFDNTTSLAFEAVMCGCPVVIIPDGTIGRSEVERGEFGLEGVAWGIDEMPGAHVDMARIREKYARIKVDAVRQLEHFIEVTQRGGRGALECGPQIALGKDEDMAG